MHDIVLLSKRMAYNILVLLICLCTFTSEEDAYDENNGIDQENENIRFFKTLRDLEDTNIDEALLYRITFPCTKWCGPGNDASHDWDLGYCSDTDMCCRTHDMCEEAILAGQTKYGLYNRDSYSKLSCGCDLKFRSCLKEVDSYLSSMMGFVYFDYLGDRRQKCFSNMHPSTCAKQDNCTNGRCQVYKYKVDEEKLYQWFDIPRYNDCKQY